MLKSVIAATAALAIGGTSLAYAQQRFGEHHHPGWGPRAEHHHRLSSADLAAFTDARIAALKAGLELTPEQAKYWPSFEQALRVVAQLRAQRKEARQGHWHHAKRPQAGATAKAQPTPPDPFNRLERHAESMAKTSAALQKLAAAGTPLYQSLTADQKARFKILSRALRPHHPRRMAFNSRGGPWQRGGHGFGPQMRHHRFGPDGRHAGQGLQL